MKNLLLSLLVMTLLISTQDLFAQCLTSAHIDIVDICQGDSFGEATVIPFNGLQPYTYQWPGGSITTSGAHTITNLQPGFFDVTITDSNNCEIQETVIIGQSEIIAIVNINGGNCGNQCVVLDASSSSGGSCGLEYEWSNSIGTIIGNDPDRVVCTPGIYTCIVSSICDGCRDTVIAEVVQTEPPFDVTLELVSPNTCGECNGAVLSDVGGGSPPYAYEWLLNGVPVGNFSTISGLCAGLVELAVTDINGCTVLNEIEMECPEELLLDTTFETVDCENDCEAFAAAVPLNGSPPYIWVWSNGATTEAIFNLCPGTYSVTVVDAVNATQVAEYNIAPTNPLNVSFNSNAANCSVGGTIEFEVNEGSGNYSYLLNGNEIFTTFIENLPPGNATIEVKDNESGCTFEEIVVVGSPYDVAIAATETDCGIDDGTATATVPNGTSTYNYLWSNGQTTQTATGLAPGGYSVTVTDTSNDCQSHENVMIEESSDCFVIISGYVIDDEANLDCIPDMTSDSVANQLISLDNTLFTFTDQDGFYSFQTEPGSHTITFESDSQVYDPLCVDPITVSLSNFGDVSEGNNFYLDIANINDIQLYMSKTTIRPGFNHFVNASVVNKGSETVTGSFEMTHDANQNFVSATPTETAYDPVTRIITWDYTNLNPNELISYQVTYNTPSTVSIGVQISVDGIVSSVAEDDFPGNNAKTCTRTVSGSYDPNDKDVQYKIEGWGPDTFNPGDLDELTYRIRFQNTGTDTAFTIVIEDELDNLINLRDVVPGPASHPYTMTVRDGNVLQFNFSNILLPDSTTNEAASHGYVYFDVNLSPDIVEGDMITNQAAIFFDFNAPIITNEVVTTFDRPVNVTETELESSMLLQPNPSNQTTTLFYHLKEANQVTINVLDITGKIINRVKSSVSQLSGLQQEIINTNQFQNGTYFIHISTSNQLITRKLVVIH